MRKISLLFILLFTSLFTWAQDSIRILDRTGKEINLQVIVDEAKVKPLLFFGELHDNATGHQLEMKLLQELHKAYSKQVILAMEMFEADVQFVIDEYFAGLINQKSFEQESRIWPNYKEDYKPLLEFARENQLKLVASNVPRRYANAVYHKGVNVLSDFPKSSQKWMAPLPLKVDTTLSTYREMSAMLPGHDASNMIYSQALKDATMAYFIVKNWKKGQVLLHVNGAYHSKNKEGILALLPKKLQGLTITINSIKEADFQKEDLNLADYTLVLK